LKLPRRIIVNNDLESMWKKWLGPIFTLPRNMRGGTKKNHKKCQNDKSPRLRFIYRLACILSRNCKHLFMMFGVK